MRSWPTLLIGTALLGGCAQLGGWLPGVAPTDDLAGSVTIVRDEWGVPQVLAPTDAAASFGLAYAQAEDDLHGIEDMYLHALGRASHWYGEQYLAADLVRRAFEVERLAREEYEREPPERKLLWDAFAAGLNYYIGTRGARPRLITRYEPWMPFALFRDVVAGSVVDGVLLGTDDARAALGTGLVGEWRDTAASVAHGSWLVAATADASADAAALLLESEAGSFAGAGRTYEALVLSEQGWHVRGRVRLGTPVPVSGHNARIAWGTVADTADHADVYEVTFDHPSEPLMYRFDGGWRAATEWVDTVRVNGADGVAEHAVRFRRTHHGPIVAERGGRALAVRIARHVEGGASQQQLAMSRASNLDEFRRALDQRAAAGAVMYADADGSIYHLSSNAVPQRAESFDWSRPVDGAASSADWSGYRSLADNGEVQDPAAGWIASAGAPPAVRAGADGARTVEAWSALPFDTRVPDAVADDAIDRVAGEWEQIGGRNASRARHLDEAVELLRSWDRGADTASEAATLFVLWQERLRRGMEPGEFTAFRALESVVQELRNAWGSPAVAWGAVNRLAPVNWPAADATPVDSTGLAVGGAPAWARTAFTFTSAPAGGSARRFGVAGTRWISLVRLGAAPRAMTVAPFGQGTAGSAHGFDQAPLYAAGRLKGTAFRREDVMASARRSYRPVELAVRELP